MENTLNKGIEPPYNGLRRGIVRRVFEGDPEARSLITIKCE
jgi:hypothetical protein